MLSRSLEDTKALLGEKLDDDMAKLVKDEMGALQYRQERLLKRLEEALRPKDPSDDKSVIVEIRAGTGGKEAGLFAADLFRMYTRYAQSRNWQVDVIDYSESVRGGFKEAILAVKGKGAFSRLKYERGVHRVQRVPVTAWENTYPTATAAGPAGSRRGGP